MVPAHLTQGSHARAPLRVPQRRRQDKTGAPAPHPRCALPTATTRTGTPHHQVRLLWQADAQRWSNRSITPLAQPAPSHPTHSRPPTLDSMSQRPPQQRRPPSQRTPLARKSTPAMLKTRPGHPTSEARSAAQTIKRPANLTCYQRAKAMVLTNAGIKHEANRISATRFDGARP